MCTQMILVPPLGSCVCVFFFVKCVVACWEIFVCFLYPVSLHYRSVPMCENTCFTSMGRSCVCFFLIKEYSTSCTVHNVRSSGGTAMETNKHIHIMSAGVFTCRFEFVDLVQRNSSLSPQSDPETTL